MRLLILALVSAGIFSGTAFSGDMKLLQQIETHFKWGEYDSIIAKLEPVVRDSIMQENSTERSSLSKFLGIAYAAQGRISEARTQFKIAYLSDSLVQLDSAYVSKTIEMIFRTTVDEYKHEVAGKALQDSLFAQKKLAAEAATRAIEKQKTSNARNTTLAVAGVCAAAFLATGIVAIYEYYSTSTAYSAFRHAADQGDLASYNRYKTIVRNGDSRTVGYLSVSCVFGICSGYFYSRYRKLSLHTSSFIEQFPCCNLMVVAYDF
jgi:hypothetical protein